MGKNESAIRLFQPLLSAIIENTNLEKIGSFFKFYSHSVGGPEKERGKDYPRHFPNNIFNYSSFYKEHAVKKF